ncbi:glycoside hydrolase family 3 C-terminal domain-containing protein [Capnocytophaga sp. oral taxon 902]|uniref:beta-glucosidase n=1 Tax=Capnocytophaga sp. oral taxon 902 TaxID=2748316 RepID=UPI0015B7CCF4|nr:glycoside hydrolase family 3 N-terminal domain-containing protein [Capnocytophaga sp. oral taxon 902]QLF50225.1 glycoside hydrolase family 3 C-terminal domain-containing protein [Capnocytophaga sp. oral taxon 902]
MNKITTFTAILAFSLSFAQQTPQLNKNNIKEVVKAMTLDEKIHFVSGIGMSISLGNDGPVAGSIGGKVVGAAGATLAIPRLGIPSVIMADGPAGLRIEPTIVNGEKIYTTAFPVGSLIASTWNTTLSTSIGKAMGNEVKEMGVDILLAPGMNLIRNPLCGRNYEYYSEDPVLSGEMATAAVNGVQSQGVGVSVKHFVANNQESNRNSVSALVSQRALRELYLRGFEIAIKKSNPWTVMSSYNKINDTYVSENPELLTTILRDEWNFKGMVTTDWFSGRKYANQVKAGNDLLMPGRKQEAKKIKEALDEGSLKETELDRNIERILQLVVKTPVFANYRYSQHPDFIANRAIAQQAAEEGMILLKNKAALPLSAGKIALLGNASYDTFVGGTGSGEVQSAYTISFYDGLKKAGFSLDENLKKAYLSYITEEKEKRPKRVSILDVIKPVEEFPISEEQLQQMSRNCEAAIITIGRNAGEGSDRSLETDYVLNDKELALIKATASAFHAQGKKLIVALNIDALVEVTSWQDLADALLITWLPGQEAGNAFANILTGKTNPSGKLPQTMALSYNDIPSATAFPGTPKRSPSESVYNEGIYVGYRYFSSFGKPVAYPFGYGLSYTQFEMKKLKAPTKFSKKLSLSVEVTNVGEVAGKEVVQVYLSAPAKSMDKPALELKAFAKTELLSPKQSQTLSFTLSPESLASFDTVRSAWVVEAGTYTVKVGNSVENILQTATFTVPKEIVVEKVADVLKPNKAFDELKR